jgi:SAM-dependent methyltransferase
MLDRLTPGRALDAACGTGAVAQQLLERGHDVVGVDIPAGMLARARQAVPGARLLVGASPNCRCAGDAAWWPPVVARHGLGEYLRAALPHGYVVRACEETYRHAHTVAPGEKPEPLTPGPPDIWELHPWIREAADAAKVGQAAVVAWDFELRPGF